MDKNINNLTDAVIKFISFYKVHKYIVFHYVKDILCAEETEFFGISGNYY